MTERARREIVTRARTITRRVPAEGATRGAILARGPARDRFRLDQSHSAVLSPVEKYLAEDGDVARRRKEAGVSRNSTQRARVLVVDDPMHVNVSVRGIHLGDGDATEQRMIGSKRCSARGVGRHWTR